MAEIKVNMRAVIQHTAPYIASIYKNDPTFPYDTGRMLSRTYVSDKNDAILVNFNTPYAIFVQAMEKHYRFGIRILEDHMEDIEEFIGQEILSELGRGIQEALEEHVSG